MLSDHTQKASSVLWLVHCTWRPTTFFNKRNWCSIRHDICKLSKRVAELRNWPIGVLRDIPPGIIKEHTNGYVHLSERRGKLCLQTCLVVEDGASFVVNLTSFSEGEKKESVLFLTWLTDVSNLRGEIMEVHLDG